MTLERVGTLTISEIAPMLTGKCNPKRYADINGYKVKISSERYKVFLVSSGTRCRCCGLKAKYFAIERHLTDETYHLNLYGTNKKGKEVLFTKDHIIPKSKDGANTGKNYQTLCQKCNTKKGNRLPE